MRQPEELSSDKMEVKAVRPIRISHFDLTNGFDFDPLLWYSYWVKVYDLYGLVLSLSIFTYLDQVFVNTGDNCNTISSTFFGQFINRGLVLEFTKESQLSGWPKSDDFG